MPLQEIGSSLASGIASHLNVGVAKVFQTGKTEEMVNSSSRFIASPVEHY